MKDKVKKEKKVTNRTRDAIADYIITNQHITKEYDEQFAEARRVKKETGAKHQWTYTEKLYTAVIVIGLVLIFVRYVILKI